MSSDDSWRTVDDISDETGTSDDDDYITSSDDDDDDDDEQTNVKNYRRGQSNAEKKKEDRKREIEILRRNKENADLAFINKRMKEEILRDIEEARKKAEDKKGTPSRRQQQEEEDDEFLLPSYTPLPPSRRQQQATAAAEYVGTGAPMSAKKGQRSMGVIHDDLRMVGAQVMSYKEIQHMRINDLLIREDQYSAFLMACLSDFHIVSGLFHIFDATLRTIVFSLNEKYLRMANKANVNLSLLQKVNEYYQHRKRVA